MIFLWLLAQLGLTLMDGGTPHPATLTWNAVTVSYANEDGSMLTRPALGYWVYRAEIKGGVQGPWVLLNPDAAVMGMANDDGTPTGGWYEDETAAQGSRYVYTVSAVDLAGESPQSPVSESVLVPINPNAPGNFQAIVN